MFKKILFLSLASLFLAGCSLFPAEEKNNAQDENIPLTIKDTQLSQEIVLNNPTPDQVLKSPFLVSGTISSNEDKVYVRVKNEANESVIEAWTAVKSGADNKKLFSVFINFKFRGTKNGTVEVFTKDKEGKELNIKSIPVKFVTE